MLYQEVETAVKAAGVQSQVPHSVFVCVASMRETARELDAYFAQKLFLLTTFSNI